MILRHSIARQNPGMPSTGAFLAFLLLAMLCLAVHARELDLARLANRCIASGDLETRVVYHPKSGLMDLSTRFRQEGTRRACWDFPLEGADLSRCAGIRLRFRVLNGDLAHQLNFYCKAGGVWYQGVLTPHTNGLWEEQVLSKASFLPEGEPVRSWRKAETLRFAAWRGASGDFSLQIASLEILEANVPLALVRGGGSSSQETTRRESLRHAQNLGESLSAGGIYPAILEEADLSPSALRNVRCAILPYGESLEENAENTLCAYLRQGGRLAAFYALPPRLANVMHLPAGRFRKASAIPGGIGGLATQGGASFRQGNPAVLAVENRPYGDLKIRAWWTDSSGKKTVLPAIIQCPYGFWMTYVYLKQDEAHAVPVLAAFLEDHAPGLRNAASTRLLEQARFALANAGAGSHQKARKLLERAQSSRKTGDYTGVFTSVLALEDALAQEAMPAANLSSDAIAGNADEIRGVWMRAAGGLSGKGWNRTLRQLKDAGFNAVFPHLLSPYAAAWNSRLVSGRLEPSVDDPTGECVAAAQNQGIQVHAWVQVLNVTDAPQSFRKRLEEQGRLQQKESGQSIPWLCPTQRENRQLLSNLVGELARKYPLAGVQLDMLRYEGSSCCYCPRCRAAFQQYLGRALKNWPEDLRQDPRARTAWEAFRVRQITMLAQELADAARRARPKIKVSAAVYPEWENARKSVGQAPLDWLQKGIVDFLCPMDYRASAALLQGDLARQRQNAGSQAERILPGIGATASRLSIPEIKRQIQAVRNAGMGGYVIFEWTAQLAEQWLTTR